MARPRDPARLDTIVAAATWAFTHFGFDRAKVHQVADRAQVGPGTVYLYAGDKEALFELAMLRALESPVAAHPELPYRKTRPEGQARLIEECLHEITHFPQLWVASQRREHDGSVTEFYGILRELIRWFRRYRSAILLAERNRLDWPELASGFDRVVWTDLQRRLTGYLASRMRSGTLTPIADAALVARFTIDALIATLVIGPLTAPSDRGDDEEAIVRLVGAGVLGSGNGSPFLPHSSQDSTV